MGSSEFSKEYMNNIGDVGAAALLKALPQTSISSL